MKKNPSSPETEKPPTVGVFSRFRGLKVMLVSLLVLIALLVLLLGWAIKSESGTKVLFSFAQYLSAGSLQIKGVHGSIGDDLELDQFSFHSASLKIEASGIHLIWQPVALRHRQLLIDRLHITSLLIASKSDPTPASLPQQLSLPMGVSARDLALGQLLIADLQGNGQTTAPFKLSALTGQLTADQHQYKAKLAFNSPWGNVDVSSLNLDTQRPFAVRAVASLRGQVVPDIAAVNVAATVDGSLQTLKLRLQAQLSDEQKSDSNQKDKANSLSGHANAIVTPFAAQMLQQLQIDVQHLNPAAWAATAPVADLRILVNAHPDIKQKDKADHLRGEIHVTNAMVSTLDKNALPVQEINTQFAWQGTQLRLPDLQIKLAGEGTARGMAQVDWQTAHPKADAQIQLNKVDLLHIDQRLRHTQISGELTAKTGEQEQIQVQAQLHDTNTQFNADVNYDKKEQRLSLKQFKLASQESHVDGQGDITFAGNQGFHFKGKIVNFDPSKWLAVPSGLLQAELSANGQLLPSLSVAASLPYLQGHYAGQAVLGNADLQWHARELHVHQLDLHWGSNYLNVKGAWGAVNDELKLQVDAPQLSELNALLVSQDVTLNGDVKGNVVLQGGLSAPAGQLDIQSEKLHISKARQEYSVQNIHGKMSLSHATDGVADGEISAQHLRADVSTSDAPEDKVEQIKLTLKGRRDAHQIVLQAVLPEQRNVLLQLSGGLHTLPVGKGSTWGWDGQLQSLSLNGQNNAHLVKPTTINISPQSVQLASMQFESNLANVWLDQFEWTPQSLKTQGRIVGARVTDLVNFFKPQFAVTGGLKLNADWNIQLTDAVRGEINIQKQSGDLRFNDPDGTGTPIPLGIHDMQMQLKMGGLVAGTDGQRINLTLNADGTRLGQLHLQADSLLSKVDAHWTVSPSAPLNGKVSAVLPDLEWVGSWINPGLVLKGKLNLDAKLSGNLNAPHYHADIVGRELEVAFASEDLLLPNGVLDAQIDDTHLKLTRLQFSNTVTMLPNHDQFKGWDAIGKRGEFNASGELDIGKETGAIEAQWQQFPLLQRKDRWLQISGQASIVEANNIWSLNGKVNADGAYFKLPKLPPPSLSSDVMVTRKADKLVAKNSDATSPKKGLKTRVDVSFDMGSRFVFVGRGLDTSLSGSLRLRSIDGSPLQATGSINTVKGSYEGYGQQLTIERGILNFQGPPANPGLNIRALREGLPVEAGVEVVGTVVAPQVRLVSEPDVPDAEKLTWLVLGRGSDQLAGGDASLLMSAATAIFGGDGSRNVPKDIVQGLGFDEFSIGNSSGSPSSHVPGQTVAGATSTATATNATSDQVVSVGKHLMPGLVLAVERGLGDASGAVKLSWQLTRRITIVGRTGSESAVDVNYTFSFN